MGQDVLRGQESRRLVSVVPDLMQRDQLVGEGVGLLLALLEVQGIVEIRPRGERAMVRQSVEVRSHRVDGSKRRVCRRRHRGLDAVVLALMLSKQSPLLL